MSEIQVRLNQLRTEIDRDNRLISQARARINARESELVSLRQQLLVSQHLENGSLPAVCFNRLEAKVTNRGIDAMRCTACHDRPDDARLNNCGHLYCNECLQNISDSRCQRISCRKRLRRGTDIDNALFEGLCARFGVSFDVITDSEDETGDNASDQITPLQVVDRQASPPDNMPDDGNSSEDDGFDKRSQRSGSYCDDGDSFVSEDESIRRMGDDFEADENGETDTSMENEDSISIYSESDGVLEQL